MERSKVCRQLETYDKCASYIVVRPLGRQEQKCWSSRNFANENHTKNYALHRLMKHTQQPTCAAVNLPIINRSNTSASINYTASVRTSRRSPTKQNQTRKKKQKKRDYPRKWKLGLRNLQSFSFVQSKIRSQLGTLNSYRHVGNNDIKSEEKHFKY